ncbi:GGDEF domain-containing protein [Sulfurospirillum arcachonense]|uniref:GGDEF domain-containing protein n=1 Tax=Sulfurospirillum arcachonense TaxID=57666 RepID=UPI0004688667|nr:diguanylate cyclase [Sulfurospirillum arcachonense]
MVRLDKNKIQSGLGRRAKMTNDSQDAQDNQEVDTKRPQSSNSELEKFSLYVLKVLMDENIPTTPNNFQIYFEKLLDNKPLSFKKRINDLLEAESVNDDEHRAKMEMEVKEGFGQIKSIMQVVSTVYKNINVMKEIVKKRTAELEVNSGQLSITNITSALNEDLKKLSFLMNKQMGTLKTHYEKTGIILKEIESKAVFDSRFGVYNRRYLLQSVENECSSIEQFSHKSTLVLAKVKDDVLNKIVSNKDRMVLTRNIAKLLLKTSRRSDVVAHYGDGVFGMLMKHTDINNAKRACERISDLIYATSFFIGDMEVDTDIELAIVPIDPEHTTETLVSLALDALPKTGKRLEPYWVCEMIEEVEEQMEEEDGA